MGVGALASCGESLWDTRALVLTPQDLRFLLGGGGPTPQKLRVLLGGCHRVSSRGSPPLDAVFRSPGSLRQAVTAKIALATYRARTCE